MAAILKICDKSINHCNLATCHLICTKIWYVHASELCDVKNMSKVLTGSKFNMIHTCNEFGFLIMIMTLILQY